MHADTQGQSFPFGEPGRDIIDFGLIESEFRHPLRVTISVREGAISSAMLLRRFRVGVRKNATYTAFREVGRVTDGPAAALPFRRPAAPAGDRNHDEVEASPGFSRVDGFGKGAVITDNEPVELRAVR
ncbi:MULTISPECIES: Tn3 family transposase [Streptomyces]|uniref:Tn3 transposase DDE domain-containing protein n=2 Tax=Streptomyces TaxID=1883 RepID=A0A100Y2E6_9ACTN|nr:MULTISPECIES: Tn3 family transposase [Streptomyces]KUH36399.1 hypothetical protein ATE80_23790 [Streptomyces kanasensis]UUS35097.1 transposase [Streptomyces changanensis]